MAAGFRTRRVKTEQSIGDKLKRTRIRKKISIAEVEEATKIRAKFILALESDSWEQIPSEVYGRGYLETYLQFLQLPVEALMKQYGRERELYARHCQEAKVELSPKSQLRLPRFILTPRFFAIGLSVAALLGGSGVVAYQVQRFSANPYLKLLTPTHAKADSNGELEATADSVNITGKTAPGSTVKVNGQPVAVADDGSFSQPVTLQPGTNAIVVDALSKGKKSTEIISVRR